MSSGGGVMKLPRRRFLHLAATTVALPAVARLAWAQSYPSRPVRLIVGFTAGGGSDILARLTGQGLSERVGQPFVIENRTGAGSNIATELVVNAPADGHTLLLATTANAVNATLYDKLNFNFIRDIAPVAGFFARPMSCWSIHRSRRGPFPSSLPMPWPIRPRSTWDPAATEARSTWPVIVQDDGRCQSGARALSRRGACAN
jgi:hypothetical protein